MGVAHTIMHPRLLKRLADEYSGWLDVQSVEHSGDRGLVLAKVRSSKMPLGYHGMVNIVIDRHGEIVFLPASKPA